MQGQEPSGRFLSHSLGAALGTDLGHKPGILRYSASRWGRVRAVYIVSGALRGRGGKDTTDVSSQLLTWSRESAVDVGDAGWHNLGRGRLGVGWHLPAHSSDPKFGSFYFGVGIKREALGETNIERAGVMAENTGSSSSAHEGLMKRQGFL